MPVFGSDAGRPGRAHAAAEDVGADDEEAVGVDRLAGADQRLPPAGLVGDRVLAGDVLIAGQRVADEDGVRLGGVQRAVGLVGDRDRRQRLVAVEPQRLARGQVQDLARGIVGLGETRAQRSPASTFAKGGCTGIVRARSLPALDARATKNRPEQRAIKAAHPIPVRAARFSDLFNVVASRPAKSPRGHDQIAVQAGSVKRRGPRQRRRSGPLAFAFRFRRLYHLPRLLGRRSPFGPHSWLLPLLSPNPAFSTSSRTCRARASSRGRKADQAVLQRDAARAEPEGDRRLQGGRR